MVLVGEHREAYALVAELIEKRKNSLVRGGVVFAMLGIVGAVIGEGPLKNAAVPGKLRGNEALDQLDLAIAHLVAELVLREGWPAAHFAHMVARAGKVFKRVEQRSIQIKYHVRVGHAARLSTEV